MSLEKIMRNRIWDYLNIGTSSAPSWSFMGDGFNTINETTGAQTDKKIYVNNTTATTTIKSYETVFPFDTDLMVNGDADTAAIEKLYNVGRNHLVGTDAEAEYVRVEMWLPATPGSTRYFKARKFKVAVEVSNVNGAGGETIVVTGNLNCVGDPIDGYFDITTLTFKEGSYNETLGTLTVTSAAGTLSGNTKITVNEALSSGNLYMYKTASTVTLPALNDSAATGYTPWNGADITATTGNEILIVECNTSFLIKKAGKATVTAKA